MSELRLTGRTAFSMLEVMTVMVIVGLLGSVVVPLFAYSANDAKDAQLMQRLQYLRKQIELFRVEHRGRPPGFNGMHPWFHLVLYSSVDGDVSLERTAECKFGPYVQTFMVISPVNQGMQVVTSSNPSGETPDESRMDSGELVGWFYDPVSGRLAANAEGTTASGVPRIEL